VVFLVHTSGAVHCWFGSYVAFGTLAHDHEAPHVCDVDSDIPLIRLSLVGHLLTYSFFHNLAVGFKYCSKSVVSFLDFGMFLLVCLVTE